MRGAQAKSTRLTVAAPRVNFTGSLSMADSSANRMQIGQLGAMLAALG